MTSSTAILLALPAAAARPAPTLSLLATYGIPRSKERCRTPGNTANHLNLVIAHYILNPTYFPSPAYPMSPHIFHIENLRRGRFLIQRSIKFGNYLFPPRDSSTRRGDVLEWAEVSGEGVIRSVYSSNNAEHDGMGLIELNEGPRMFSRVLAGNSDALKKGARVRIVIRQPDVPEDEPEILFEVLQQAA